MLNVSFVDPDGMHAEVCWIRDPPSAGFSRPGGPVRLRGVSDNRALRYDEGSER